MIQKLVLGSVIIGLPFISVYFLIKNYTSKVEAQNDTLLASQSVSDDPLHPTIAFYVDAQARTISQAFEQAGVDFYQEDKVVAFPNPTLGIGSMIKVERALPIDVRDGKKLYRYRTWQTTINGLLDEKRILLGADDRISYSLSTKLTKNMEITITRVARTQLSEFEEIPFKEIRQNDPNIWRGEVKIAAAGHIGKREKKYLLVREDGELVSKTLISDTITVKPEDRLIKIGTKLKIGQTFKGKATWYSGPTRVAIATSLGLKKGQEIRITNLANGKQIIVVIDDYCACPGGASVDLRKDLFTQLGASLSQGVMASVKIEEVLN